MKLTVGIVGLPNVGKSTLFKALTKKQVDTANYPFCTIDPNVGIVPVPDDRLQKLVAVYQSAAVVPTVIEFVDIAGLVAGAHTGEGLGNKFLSHIRTVDAICQVVRGFTDPDVTHVSGHVDPESDKQTINLELVYADLATVIRRIEETAPRARSGDKEGIIALGLYEKVRGILDRGTLLADAQLTDEEQAGIRDLNLLTLKPMLYVLNVDESSAAHEQPGYVVISAKVEAELAEMPETDAREYLRTLGLTSTGLDRLISAAYRTLDLITFFTAGPKETHAWTVQRGAPAPVAGGRIHSDFEEKFIRAEVASWQDIVTYGGETGAKAKGRVRIEGREYIVQDGDVIYFRI
ncbi:MAG: redox-regulated ATPase YchF [Patescibacteria group bacterium]|nr:redox-regulated ATPase YchF [Patescibacteria group bacterium]MDD5715820.1 redox-regulated ATPase YchF [Patescibacteria group bacterium]